MNTQANEALSNVSILCGNANQELTHKIARQLQLPVGKAQVARFSDGEINLAILENNRGRDVFSVQATCPPVNDHVM